MSVGPIDQNVLEELEDSVGADFADELITTFLEEAPVMLDTLKSASEGSDPEGYRRAAHTIKSNAETFGAKALADLARALELNGLDATPTDGVVALEAEYTRAAAALEEFLNGLCPRQPSDCG